MDLPVLHMVRTPRIARRLSRLLVLFLILLPPLLLLVPWTQTAHGTGQAIAFNPVERPQFIVAPIEGRIKKWYVVEGDHVRTGEPIVEMVDNDPDFFRRLLDEEKTILDRLRAAENRVQEIASRIENLRNSRSLALSVADQILRQEQARVQSARQDVITAEANLEAAIPQEKRLKELQAKGLVSVRDVELATQALVTAQAQRSRANEMVSIALAGEQAARDNREKVDADTQAMINLESALRQSGESDVAAIRREKVQIETRIARQLAQFVNAPTNGTIFRLLANAEQGGILVRPGERLAVLVPDINQRTPNPKGTNAPQNPLLDESVVIEKNVDSESIGEDVVRRDALPGPTPRLEGRLTQNGYPGIVVELHVDGNDLPLIQKGDMVRLQFEGWPAVQFVGWPSVAVGTFGGRVYLVDPTANEKGTFRILVEPDQADQPWPDTQYLRQGVRAQGWVLLNRVTLGWELWRRLNGFPQARERKDEKPGQVLGPVKRKELK